MSSAEPGSFCHALEDGEKTKEEEEEAEKDKEGDERRKRLKKVREERMACLFAKPVVPNMWSPDQEQHSLVTCQAHV